MAIVYKHTNKTTLKCYIGCTNSTIEKRWREHIHYAKKNINNKFSNAIRKYGTEDWEHEVILSCLKEDMFKYEIEQISNHNSVEFGYNTSPGGGSHSNFKGKKHSESTKKYLSELNKGKNVSLLTRTRMSNSLKGTRTGTNNPKSKPVYLIQDNIKTKYDSASILSKKLDIPLSTICRWAKNGKHSVKHNLSVEYI